MNELAPAKVNLCLFLGPVRPDGRHELVTLFESISLADELELTVLDDGPDEVLCPGVEGPNLALSALRALREAGWAGPPVRVQIAKRIPVAAGLGGGSSDAAAALRLADRVSPLADGLAERIARQLGADVPSQLRPGLWLGTGAGDEVAPAPPPREHAFVIVPQAFPLATVEVYREADRLGLSRSTADLARCRREVEAAPLSPDLVVNDLERATVSLASPVSRALEDVRAAGADHALVCGSGPTVMGVYWGDGAPDAAASSARRLRRSHPSALSATPVLASQ